MTEISREQWQNFCDPFTRSHHGWLVTLGRIRSDVLKQDSQAADTRLEVLVDKAIFQEITPEDRGDHLELLISLGEKTQHLTHRVVKPERIFFEETGEGAHAGLRIDSADGQTTLLRFRTPARPETLDGLAEFER
jgi:hypothetical protein